MFRNETDYETISDIKRHIDILVTDFCSLDKAERNRYQRNEDKAKALLISDELGKLTQHTEIEHLAAEFCKYVRIYSNADDPSISVCSRLFSSSIRFQFMLNRISFHQAA